MGSQESSAAAFVDERGEEQAKRELKELAPQYLQHAIELHQQGQLEQAEKIYFAVLEVDEDNVDALHYLGVMRHQQGRSLFAIDLVVRAIALAPEYVDAHNNLGNILHDIGSHTGAAEAYKKVLELRPDHPPALRNLGIVLRLLKRFDEAREAHERAIAQEPQNVANLYGLAAVYREMGRIDDALATLRKALAARAEPDGYRLLGQLLYGLHRIDEAAGVYEAWLRLDPQSPAARHMLAACTLKDVPARAADDFVTDVFDGFADTFDRVLRRLEYRAPVLVGEALQRVAGEARGELDIADIGCGTGLLGEHLRPYARRLIGVDLSTKMLQKAAMRSWYDETIAAELGSFLRSRPGSFDVVASSDTLVYFGDLREVFAAAYGALRAGGWLLFTLEHARNEAEVPQGYRIHPHGRYSHTEFYVRKSLAEAGFEAIDIQSDWLRREGSKRADGLIVAARRKRND